MTLVPCESCGRHVRGPEAVCPFCRSTRTRSTLAMVALGSAFAMACATKYGAPPPPNAPEPEPPTDAGGSPPPTDEPAIPPPPVETSPPETAPPPSARLSGRY